jgi:hypothetical protein
LVIESLAPAFREITQFLNCQITQLFDLLVRLVFPAARTKLAELQTIGGRFLVLGGGIVLLFANRTL